MPANVTEVRSFLTLTRYRTRFVKDFLRIASSLTNLLRKMTKFEWSHKCEEVFQELKRWLTTAHILTLPVEGKEYTIYSVASRNSLDCVLMQDDEGIKPSKKNYPPHYLQLAAVVIALKF